MPALSWLDAGGVQNLCPEISQFGGFLEVQATHWCCGINEARIIIVHPIDIRPDLDLVNFEGSTDEGGRVVTPPTLQVVNIPEGIATDIALRDEKLGI